MASGSAGPVPNHPGPAPRESRPEPRRRTGARRAAGGSRRGAFRAWRRSRPFWGGLLLLLAGLEMLLIPLTGVLAKGQIKLVIYVGVGGIFGILIGALLIACALAIWFNQAHKTFYAIAGVLLAILSFIGTNLGGFFIGMLLGIVGGSLAFGWTPTEPGTADEVERPRPPEPPSEGVGLILGDADAHHDAAGRDVADDDTLPGRYAVPADRPSQDDEPEQRDYRYGDGPARYRDDGAPAGPRHRSRGGSGSGGGQIIAFVALLALAAGTLMTGGRASAAESAPARPRAAGQNCILFVICSPSSPSPSPSPSPSSSSSSGSGGSSGILPIIGSSPSASASGGTGGSGGSKNKNASKNKKADRTAGLVVSSSPTVLTANSATLNGLAYQGVVNMPVAGGGTVQMMKFTMNSQSLTTATQTANDPGHTLTTKLSSGTFSGSVVLYATKLSGRLLGIPVTLTPGNVVSTLLQVLKSLTPLIPVTMTDVTANQPVVLADSATINGLAISAS
jgi:hypothetical protein